MKDTMASIDPADHAKVFPGAYIGEGATIRKGAYIGEGADIGGECSGVVHVTGFDGQSSWSIVDGAGGQWFRYGREAYPVADWPDKIAEQRVVPTAGRSESITRLLTLARTYCTEPTI